MLSVVDTIRALSELIAQNFPNYPVHDRDIAEGFERPSYFLDISESRSETVTASYIKEETDLLLYFFAEDRYSGFLELLDMKNNLVNLLSKPLEIGTEEETAHVIFNSINAVVTKDDKTLTCSFTSELIQKMEVDEGEYIIENVEFDLERSNKL